MESASVVVAVIEKGGAGSSGISPKGAEPPTQSINLELVVRKRKRQLGLVQRRGETFEVSMACF